MEYIGIKDLKNQATQILKSVREEGTRYVVTYHGRPTAVILPLDEAIVDDAIDRIVDDVADDEDDEREREREALRQEIAAAWRTDLTAVEVISEQRR